VAVVAASLGGARNAAAEERHTLTRSSRFSVAETVQRLEASVHRRGRSVFACFEQARGASHDAGDESTLVVVLESLQGGTPVLMRGDGERTQSDIPLSLIVRPLSDGASEVIFPTDFGQWEDWQELLPQDLAADIAQLPSLVADALQ
jgi:uncharacterized protein (DUF302 family)